MVYIIICLTGSNSGSPRFVGKTEYKLRYRQSVFCFVLLRCSKFCFVQAISVLISSVSQKTIEIETSPICVLFQRFLFHFVLTSLILLFVQFRLHFISKKFVKRNSTYLFFITEFETGYSTRIFSYRFNAN